MGLHITPPVVELAGLFWYLSFICVPQKGGVFWARRN
jgi:hypothetical protein